ncbi:MAG: hypothetical protein JO284_14155, partial [Planctomycetaceae bacterium]|nr:hypothetical protein [Planctomycetaceae bacterium]
GTPPDLTRLDAEGDPFHKVDFRSVYAGVLRDWLNADAGRVLDGQFEPLALV